MRKNEALADLASIATEVTMVLDEFNKSNEARRRVLLVEYVSKMLKAKSDLTAIQRFLHTRKDAVGIYWIILLVQREIDLWLAAFHHV